jgi:hypothetical protein
MMLIWVLELENYITNQWKLINLKKMSFNKGILRKDNILNNLDRLFIYLNSDATIITDDFSKEIYHRYCKGESEEEIINYIKSSHYLNNDENYTIDSEIMTSNVNNILTE